MSKEYEYFPGQLVWCKTIESFDNSRRKLQYYSRTESNSIFKFRACDDPQSAIDGLNQKAYNYIEPVKVEDLIDYIGPPDLSNEIVKFRYIYIERFQWLDKPNNNLYTGINLYLADNSKDHNGRHYSIQWELGKGQELDIHRALINAGEIQKEEFEKVELLPFWQLMRQHKVTVENKTREVTKKVMKEAFKHKPISPYKN